MIPQQISLWFRLYPVLKLAALCIPLLLLFSSISISIIHASHQHIITSHLQTTLTTITSEIKTWHQRNTGTIQILRDSENGQRLLPAVLQADDPAAARAALDSWLYPLLQPIGYEGYFVLDRQRKVVAAATEAYLGDYMNQPEMAEILDQVLQGTTAISRPVDAWRGLRAPSGNLPSHSLMQNLCTLLEVEQQMAGYFCLRANPHHGLFPIFNAARSGLTGEAYALDAQGFQLSPLRFASLTDRQNPDKPLAQRRLSDREPAAQGEQGPLTRIAHRLTRERGWLLELNYLNYHGRQSIGAATWLDGLGMGVIVEQDLDEAFAPWKQSRNAIIALSAGALLLLLLLTTGSVISRRKLAIRAGRFRALLQNIPAPVYMTDPDCLLTVTNPAFRELLAQGNPDVAGVEELCGRHISELPVPPRLQPLFTDACRQPDSPVDTIHEIRQADGRRSTFRVIRFPVYATDHRLPHAAATILIDITEQTAVNQRLEQLVSGRTAELLRAKEEAQAAASSKAAFLAAMSHEIRTPLSAIIGLAGLAMNAGQPETIHDYLGKIRASGEHLLRIINDILDISRMEAGKLQLDAVDFSLREVIDRVVDLVWDKAHAKGLELQVDIDDSIPPVLKGDPLRLGQILINLASNAVKYTPHGQVCLRVWHCGGNDNRISLQFEVEDTGIGMSPATLESLFQPFQRASHSHVRDFEGSGLGLAICKNLADLMQARLDVTSTEGMGSCFRLRIEVAPGESQAWPDRSSHPGWTPTASRCGSRDCCRILLVEDDRLNQELAEALLRQFGFNVTVVSNGQAAVDAVKQHEFDIVLMDIQMPLLDGFGATAAIRSLPAGATLPIIAMTANAMPDDRLRCLDAGMDDYIAKPVDPGALCAMLNRWCKPAQQQETTSPAEFAVLQQAGIDTAHALNLLLQDTGLYRHLLNRFAEEKAALPDQLRSAWQQDSRGTLRNEVHALKSLAASLGMVELQQAAVHLEQGLRNDSAVATDLDKLVILLSDTIKLVQDWRLELIPAREQASKTWVIH